MKSGKDKSVVLINVFTVAAENQRELVELLERATLESIAHAPGFQGADLYRSLDGTKVTMHARWRSAADHDAMRRSGGSERTLAAALAIAHFDPAMYELARSFHGGPG